MNTLTFTSLGRTGVCRLVSTDLRNDNFLHQRLVGQHVALKILKDDLTASELRQQESEFEILKKLNDGTDSIIRILNRGNDELILQNGKSSNVSYMAMDYVDHGDLHDEISRQRNGRFSENRAKSTLK